MSRHTPGKWQFWSSPEGAWTIFGPGGPYDAPVLASRSDFSHRAEESLANGRLMFAAPELLASARSFLAAWDDWFRETLTTGELSEEGLRRCDKAAEALRAECLKAGDPS